MGLISWLFDSIPSNFLSILDIKIESDKYVNEEYISSVKTIPFTYYNLEEIFKIREILEGMTVDDNISLIINFGETTYKLEGYNECDTFLNLLKFLTEPYTCTEEYKYEIEINFKESNIFYKNTVDINHLQKICETLNSSYSVSCNPIPITKDGFESVRKGMKFEKLQPHNVLRKIKLSAL